jgi:hypothetical protein
MNASAGLRKDHAATAIARLEKLMRDPRSHITLDNRIFLFGVDMTERRREIWERDKRRCVLCGDLVSWDQFHLDHHPVSRGQGGDDSLKNLRTLDQKCHLQGPNSKHA